MRQWIVSLRGRGLAVQSAALGVAVAAAFVLVAPWAAWHGGRTGLAAAFSAAVFCALGAEGGLLIGRPFRHTPRAWLGMLLGMFPRMAIPIGLGLAIQLQGGPLAEAGLLVYLVVFYPVTLAVETAMSLPGSGPAGRPGPGDRGPIP